MILDDRLDSLTTVFTLEGMIDDDAKVSPMKADLLLAQDQERKEY